jgi:uncharacterized protein (DUF1778 family)
MAKTKRTKKSSPAKATPTDSGETVTYSTRFTKEQRELVEEAAKVMDCSGAKFMRDATVMRAAEVVNTSGESRVMLQRLAALVAKQMLNPEAVWDYGAGLDDDPRDPRRGPATISYESATNPDEPDPFGYHGPHNHMLPQRPANADLSQIQQAFETAGGEFARMIYDAWRLGHTEPKTYQPRIKASDLLSGGGDA